MSVTLMFFDARGKLEWVRIGRSYYRIPAAVSGKCTCRAGSWILEEFTSHRKLQEEIEKLREESLLLDVKLQGFAALEQENARLRELLELYPRFQVRTEAAELVTMEINSQQHRFVINKGGDNKVFLQQPIVDARGIVGQIIQTTPLSSTVLLITDPEHALPVEINRSGVRAIATGYGNISYLSIEHLPGDTDIVMGDLVVSSGMGQRYPKGYTVGTVVAVEQMSGEGLLSVKIEVSAKLLRVREMLILWSQEGSLTPSPP